MLAATSVMSPQTTETRRKLRLIRLQRGESNQPNDTFDEDNICESATVID